MRRTLIFSLSLIMLASAVTIPAQAMEWSKLKARVLESKPFVAASLCAGSVGSLWAAYNWKSHQEVLHAKQQEKEPLEFARKKVEEQAMRDQREIANCISMGRTPYRIIRGPYKEFKDKIACIEGDTEKVMGIRDVMESTRSFEFPVISNYLRTNPPITGKVYYGKLNSRGLCFHESWIQRRGSKKLRFYNICFRKWAVRVAAFFYAIIDKNI